MVIESWNESILPAAELVQVAALLEQTFGVTTLPSADRSFLARYQGKAVGHAALVSRRIRLGSWTGPLFLLGLVAVDPATRHQGIGTALVNQTVEWARVAGSAGVILNCGASMTGFYGRLGFRKIADRATYLRQGEFQTDDDPVMLYPFGLIETEFLPEVFLGEDF